MSLLELSWESERYVACTLLGSFKLLTPTSVNTSRNLKIAALLQGSEFALLVGYINEYGYREHIVKIPVIPWAGPLSSLSSLPKSL